jgi:O-antigen/teichoic acid export membrane protein
MPLGTSRDSCHPSGSSFDINIRFLRRCIFAVKPLRTNWQRARRLAREGSWVALGQVGAMAGSLVGVRLLTDALDPSSYGELALGLTLATLAQQTVLGPLSNAVTRFYAPAVERNALGAFLYAATRQAALATLVLAIPTALATLTLVLSGYPRLALVAGTAFLFTVVSGLGGVMTAVQSAARQRSVVALHQALDSWGRFIGAIALIGYLGATSNAALLGFTCASALVLVSQSVFLRRVKRGIKRTTETTDEWGRELFRYAAPFATWGIFTWCQMASDRWALNWFASSRDVGLYGAVYQIGYAPIYLATTMAIQFVSPILFQRAGDASDAERKREVTRWTWQLSKIAFALAIAAFLGALALHQQIFHVFVAEEYRLASPYLPWIALSGGLFATGQTLALALLGRLQPRAMTTAKILTALVGFACNIIGARFWGIDGVVAANLIFSTSFVLWMWWLFRTIQRERDPTVR